jgi:cytochrome c6
VKLNFGNIAMICLATSFVPHAFAQNIGADTFKSKCQMCHGADGVGATPAGKIAKIVSFKDPSVINAPDADLITIVKNGKNKMPAFSTKLTDDQIAAVLAYVRTLEK